jgi:hypothetical protein
MLFQYYSFKMLPSGGLLQAILPAVLLAEHHAEAARTVARLLLRVNGHVRLTVAAADAFFILCLQLLLQLPASHRAIASLCLKSPAGEADG